MLAAGQRVRRRAEFADAIRAGRRAGRGSLVVHVALPREPVPGAEVPPSARAGFVVPKTVGNAVVRNLVRRRLRHLIRDRLASLSAGATVIVRVLPGAAQLSYTELGDQLDGAIDAATRPGRGRR